MKKETKKGESWRKGYLQGFKEAIPKRPKGWRVGQTIVNFQAWLAEKMRRDMFYLSDEILEKEYNEFLKKYKTK